MKRNKRFELALERERVRSFVPNWMWWVVTAFPLVFVLVGAGILAESIMFATGARSTRGEVVHVSTSHGSESGVSYTPTIRYRRNDGRTFEAETNISSSGYDYAIGERVDILFSHDNPAEVRINSFASLYLPGLMFAGFGALFLGLIRVAQKMVGRGTNRLLKAAATAERMEKRLRAQMEAKGPKRGQKKIRGAKWQPASSKPVPSTPVHTHKPKPKGTSTIRRMR
ncbi:MAG: DUF3592 domain-containing protein [Proteobacteria bacterium]|nr:DUF3592 domain-containing protein [Pseudomonadota bacterium]